MTGFFENGIVPGVLLALIGAIVLGIFGWLKFKHDKKIVTRYLKDFEEKRHSGANTTHAISLATKLSKKRVRGICSKSSEINNHPKDKDSWRLSG